ncbi:ArsR/SmtB family transcription factor [Oceanidesulfovibrio marinus]|nr:metalloregulator ArsR/SmtB family transcription factor [Oceanidesulfovibrio marinus]
MNTKRATLAYGVGDDEEPRQTGEAGGFAEGAHGASASTLLHAGDEVRPFDAAPFPSLEEARERVQSVRQSMPDDAGLHRLSERLKALADPSRLAILNALAIAELRVSELAEAVGMSQSAVSHQLRVLRAARVVAVRREGKNAWYSMADDALVCLIRPGQQ